MKDCIGIVVAESQGKSVAAPARAWQAFPVIDDDLAGKLPDNPPPGVELFDLDGTLIAWDCQLLFRHYVVRRSWWRGFLLPVFLVCLPFAKVLGTDRMKRVFLSYLWRVDGEQLEEWVEGFVNTAMPAIYPELRSMLEKRRAEGNYTILTSASPEWYVRKLGEKLGFDLALGTPVERGALFPRLTNHKGAVKVDRLRRILPADWWAGAKVANSRGYTDSRADLPLLAVCEEAVVVNPGEALAALAGENGWTIVRPERPWAGQTGFSLRTLALLIGLGRDPGGLGGRG